MLLILKTEAEDTSDNEIKKVGDTELGVPSQCCLEHNIVKCNLNYIDNVVLEVNAKLGKNRSGVCWL